MKIKLFILLFLSSSFAWTQSNFTSKAIEQEITNWEFRMVGDSIWKPAKVPGTIIDNFVNTGDISKPLHPYYGDNEKLYQWIGEKDWEFRTTISVDPQYVGMEYFLTFESLDLFADVFVNNHPIQYHDTISSRNAFVPFEVPGAIEWYSPGDGTLSSSLAIRIIFYSTQYILNDIATKSSLTFPGGERVHGRTSQYQFGWDWGPRFVNMGIRKPVRLKILPKNYNEFRASIYNFNIKKKQAIFNLDFVHYNLDGEYEVQHTLLLNGKTVKQYTFPLTLKKDVEWKAIPYVIEDPVMWWPNGMQDGPNIYSFCFKLTSPDDTSRIIAQYEFDYAFCKTELVREKDKLGESFFFKVNGEKVYAKGANYVPDDSFNPGKNTKELIKLAKKANMNMIRVWGGGTYPDNEFYIECMKNGMMVWQDYMFACAMYPIDDHFIINAQIEADYQYDRLNHYNNIVVWCGNNENDEGWKNWGWQKEFKYSANDSALIWNENMKLFESFPPNNERYYQVKTNYISSSPKHGWGRKESMTEGDSHYWGVWWGLEPIEKYNEKVPRFMSEFGMQGMPDLRTLKKVIPDSAMNFDSPKFKNHQKHPTGFETLNHYLKEYLVVPDNMEDYSYATQVLQAYALTTAIEAQRRAMPNCMGSLIWQLNDCWPVTSWSLIDYELNPKIAYDEVKNAFSPLIISIKEESTSIQVTIVNDLPKKINENLELTISDFYGKNLWSKKLKVQVQPNSAKKCYSFSKSILKPFDLNEIYLHAFIENENNKTESFFHFVKLNQLTLPPPIFNIIPQGEKYNNFEITSNVYCPYVNASGTYLGTFEAGVKYSFWDGSTKSLVDEIYLHHERIKCLNTLLNK